MPTRCFVKPPQEQFRFVALESMTSGGTTGVRIISSMDGVTFSRSAGKVDFQPARSARRGGVVALAGETNYTAAYPCREQGGVVPTMALGRYGGVKFDLSKIGALEIGSPLTPYLYPTEEGFEQARNACGLPGVQIRGYGRSTSGLRWEASEPSAPLGGAPFVSLGGVTFATRGFRKAGSGLWVPYPAELFAAGPCRATFGEGCPFLWQGRVYFGPYRFLPQVGNYYVEEFSAFVSTTDGEYFMVHPALGGAFPAGFMEVVQTAGVFMGRRPQTDALYASEDLHTWRAVARPTGVTIQTILAGFGVFLAVAATVGTVTTPLPFAYMATVPGVWTPVIVDYNDQPRNAWGHVYALTEEGDV